MVKDSFYQEGAGTQHPDFGTQDESESMPGMPGMDWQTALRPVTIRLMHEAKLPYTKADFTIDGKQVKNLTVVAQVTGQTVQDDGHVRKINYTLEDGTSQGRITAFYNSTPEHPAPVFPLQYARFSGTLLRLSDRNYLRVNHLRAVKDPHEIFFHLLEAVTVNLIHQRGKPPSRAALTQPSASMQPSSTQPSTSNSSATVVPGTQDVPATTTQDTIASQQESQPSSSESYVMVSTPGVHSDSKSGDDSGESESGEDPPDSEAESNSGDSFKTAQSESDEEVERETDAELPQERDPYSHLTSLQREILLYLHNLDSDAQGREEGIPVTNFVWSFRRRGLDISGLGEALITLCDEGHIDEPQESRFRLINIPGRRSVSRPQ